MRFSIVALLLAQINCAIIKINGKDHFNEFLKSMNNEPFFITFSGKVSSHKFRTTFQIKNVLEQKFKSIEVKLAKVNLIEKTDFLNVIDSLRYNTRKGVPSLLFLRNGKTHTIVEERGMDEFIKKIDNLLGEIQLPVPIIESGEIVTSKPDEPAEGRTLDAGITEDPEPVDGRTLDAGITEDPEPVEGRTLDAGITAEDPLEDDEWIFI